MAAREGDSAKAPPPPHPGIARVGKYLMLDLLGEGAFGKVRLAVDETSGKEFAIKIMEKSHIKANELTLQVRREIAVMKAMRHRKLADFSCLPQPEALCRALNLCDLAGLKHYERQPHGCVSCVSKAFR